MISHMTLKPLLRVLSGETISPPPVWLMRQAGRHLATYRELRKAEVNFLHFCYTPELAIEATLQPVRRYGTDAAILFSDILVIPDALGQKVTFEENIGPVLVPIQSAAETPILDLDRLMTHLAPVFETVRLLRVALPREVSLIGFAGAPWTVATYMVEGRGGTDHGTIRGWAYQDAAGFSGLIALLVDATAEYLIQQVFAGAEVIQLFDTWAGVLPEVEYRRWVIEPTAEIVRRLKEACPAIPVIGFPRGSGALYPAYVARTGVDAVSIDANVPLEWARDNLQSMTTVQGNLDNRLLIAGGSAMDAEIDRIKAMLGGGPFIFNLGHGVLPSTPPEHVERLIERVRSSNQ
jgi:uroporphyrinogen decarboxylase